MSPQGLMICAPVVAVQAAAAPVATVEAMATLLMAAQREERPLIFHSCAFLHCEVGWDAQLYLPQANVHALQLLAVWRALALRDETAREACALRCFKEVLLDAAGGPKALAQVKPRTHRRAYAAQHRHESEPRRPRIDRLLVLAIAKGEASEPDCVGRHILVKRREANRDARHEAVEGRVGFALRRAAG